MNDLERIDLAKAYVALSNAHRSELIVPMFAHGGMYRSSNVGEFEGGKAIGEMMRDFFSRFLDVRWNVLEYRCAGEGAVEFEFAMTATEMATGKSIERKGVETIVFTDEGLVSSLEVKTG
jgi:hypothetical protein